MVAWIGTAVAIGRSMTEYVSNVCRCLSLCYISGPFPTVMIITSRLLVSCHELFRGHQSCGICLSFKKYAIELMQLGCLGFGANFRNMNC